MQTSQRRLVLVAIIVACVAGFVLLITRGERSRDLVLSIEPVDQSDDITVYVGGAVLDQGLYSLPRGSRVSEALDLAGLAESADSSSLDLAATLQDEQTIIVPERPVGSSDSDGDSSGDLTAAGAVININHATEDELQLLPGIGPVLAGKIIERRESQGPFSTIEELSEIAGISDRMIDDLRDLAVVDS